MNKGSDKVSGEETRRRGKFVWKLMAKIKWSKVEINDYPESGDQRRKSPSEIRKSLHLLIIWHLALTRSTWRLSWEWSQSLLKSSCCGRLLDLERANLIGDWYYIKFSMLFKSDKIWQQASLFLKAFHLTFVHHFHLELQTVPDSRLHSQCRSCHTS